MRDVLAPSISNTHEDFQISVCPTFETDLEEKYASHKLVLEYKPKQNKGKIMLWIHVHFIIMYHAAKFKSGLHTKIFRLSFTLSIFSIDEKKNSHAFATVAKSPYLQRSGDSKLEEDQETKRTW